MITIEMLNQSESLKGLTDAQKLAITTLSSNDEATVIGTKIGALHGQYDADILSISGISKADGEKLMTILSEFLVTTRLSLMVLRHYLLSSRLRRRK